MFGYFIRDKRNADETEKKSLFKKLAASLTRKDGPK